MPSSPPVYRLHWPVQLEGVLGDLSPPASDIRGGGGYWDVQVERLFPLLPLGKHNKSATSLDNMAI